LVAAQPSREPLPRPIATPRIFAESSYILPIAWLLIVPCWIVILKPAILKPRQDSPEPPPATA